MRQGYSMPYENINCPIFKGWGEEINTLSAALDNCRAGGVKRTRLANQLCREADSLLACRGYDSKSLNCGNCRAMASRRKFLAELVTKRTARLVVHLAGTREIPPAPDTGAVKFLRRAK